MPACPPDYKLDKLTTDEAIKLDLEDCPITDENLDALVEGCLEDFPEDIVPDKVSEYTARIAQANITKDTRNGHIRIIKHYIAFCKHCDGNWDPTRVDSKTPHDIRDFITQKCGTKEEGCEGRRFSTAVSTHAALTFWYRTLRPNESVCEWRHDLVTDICHGLPTQSQIVSTFMVGLKKTKAKMGEVSQSARALTLEDMYCLHDECLSNSVADQRWGVVRYTAYLLTWLMFLRIDEVVNLEFSSIEIIPSERSHIKVALKTRKTAQTGVLHTWKLHANDLDAQICPVQAIIQLATLYGDTIELSGPLLLCTSSTGAVMQSQPIVHSLPFHQLPLLMISIS
ncbi:hypothetical protein DXG01_005380 [Tephrocybe rancida]|nr:hypothetical protein DXG01_005380 [Tephrocybe rancida]